MRIGVEAGEVLVDVERASGPRDRMLTGDAVNTAARLQAAADPDPIRVGPSGHRRSPRRSRRSARSSRTTPPRSLPRRPTLRCGSCSATRASPRRSARSSARAGLAGGAGGAGWAQGPIMVVATARAELYETRPTWGGGKRNAASIYLDPLSEGEGEAMLDGLLPGPIAPELKRTIVERSEGNPLYVEEIVRKLIDDGVLGATEAARWEVARPVEDVELPRSVQGLIAVRLEGLPEDEKEG